MKTPLCDFVEQYANQSPLRLHMPGHKGKNFLGLEDLDITEIDGADVLYHESGILLESQRNASLLFQSRKTLYSTEGATLCIRGMLTLVKNFACEQGQKPVIAAARNAHKSFLTSCALLDLDPIWIGSESQSSLLSVKLSPSTLEAFLREQKEKVTAVYLTSPDYLGNLCDLAGLARVCHENGSLLLVDNAHGAYLRFLPESIHPLTQGADLVCDSAHKTLPVLTGGAYLHIAKNSPHLFDDYAENAMSLFASTSPSYLILQSLDRCNAYLDTEYPEKLYAFCAAVVDLKKKLKNMGFSLTGDEPLKITVRAKFSGYTGEELAVLLRGIGIEVEFADPDYLVLMLTPELGPDVLTKIEDVFSDIPIKEAIVSFPPALPPSEKVLSPRQALFAPCHLLPLSQCEGKILAQPAVACPPAIPIAICGERIQKEHIKLFEYYGTTSLSVIK